MGRSPMTWTQGSAAAAAEGPAEPEQETPGLPQLPQFDRNPGLVPRRPGALREPERRSQERQEQHPGPQLSPVMAKEPELQT